MARFALRRVVRRVGLGSRNGGVRVWPGWTNRRIGAVAAVGLAVAAMLPLLPNLPYTVATVNTPRFFTSSAMDTIPANSVAVVYPPTTAKTAPPNPDSTLWQASADMRFKMPGAYALVPGPRGIAQWGSTTLTTEILTAIEGGARVQERASLREALGQSGASGMFRPSSWDLVEMRRRPDTSCPGWSGSCPNTRRVCTSGMTWADRSKGLSEGL